ncbi:hypothetical protein DFH06DRAFT_416127 [Mycena polygramma]|nr:hypothetical protein DFH06DRAFT_416127 [Mycena polygramma]
MANSTRQDHRSRDLRRHMADTYAWVDHHFPADSRGTKTEKWVLDQQILYSNPRSCRRAGDTMMFMYDDEAQRHRDEQFRQFAEQKEKERRRARIIEDKMKQIEHRIRDRREAERQRITVERLRMAAEQKERERNERTKADQAIRDAWARYEKGWQDLQEHARTIALSAIPWPILTWTPASNNFDLADMTATEIGSFFLSPSHSAGQTGKERIRRAQLLWHPDRFQRVLQRVVPSEKNIVEAGAGLVARCLNDLMMREVEKARR